MMTVNDPVSNKTTSGKGRRYVLLKLADFSKRHMAMVAVLFGAVGGVWLLNSSSASHPTPSIYLTPDTKDKLTAGSTLTVQIREDSGSASVNAVAVRLDYPADLLECTGRPDGTNSDFDIDIEEQRFKGNEEKWTQFACPAGQGKVLLNRGSVEGITGDKLVASVTFRVKADAGEANLSFGEGTELNSTETSNDILGSLSATVGGRYTIGEGGNSGSTKNPVNSPTMYLTPEQQVLKPGSTLTVQIRENSGSTAINAAAVRLNYPTDLLECATHPDGAGSGFNIDIEEQRFKNKIEDWNKYSCPPGAGKVVINRGSVEAVTGDKLIASVTFKVKAANGIANLTFGDGTELNAVDNGNNVLSSLSAAKSGRYQVGTVAVDPKTDLNKDGKVDAADLQVLLLHFATKDAVSDIDRNGTVDVTDMSLLLSNYTVVPSAPPVQ